MGTVDLSPEAVGIYIRLLCYQWEKGSVPTDPETLARIAGCTSNACASIMHKFCICKDGTSMKNARLEEVRQKQELFREKRVKAANARWSGINDDAHAYAHAMHKPCSPSPTPSSKDNTVAAMPLPVPDWLKSSWDEWLEARKQAKRKPYTSLGAIKQVKALSDMGPARAIAAIEYSIRQNYQGIYEENSNKKSNGNTDQRPNSRSYEHVDDYSKVQNHGVEGLP